MNWKVVAGVAGGFAAGYGIANYVNESTLSDPEKVLSEIKKKFSSLGQVEGTWILMTPEKYHDDILDYDVYQGGITVVNDKSSIVYEFIADAKTGAVLSVTEGTYSL